MRWNLIATLAVLGGEDREQVIGSAGQIHALLDKWVHSCSKESPEPLLPRCAHLLFFSAR